MTREEIISALNDTVDDAISKVNASIPATQRRILDEVEQLVRDLDYDGNDIKVTAKNMRVIGAIKNKLRKIILDANYQENVKEYLTAFNAVTTLQNSYMRQMTQDFKFTPVFQQLKEQSITSTIEALTEQGLTANVIDKIQDVLRKNITTGGTFKQLTQQVRETIVSTRSGEGILERYVKQITTDAIATYSRNYLQIATDSLNMDWFDYSGSLKTTSRCFCEAMRKKRYFHRLEIPDLIAGKFPEWEQESCEMYAKTGLPQGFIPGTNATNFLTNLGGFNCTHRGIPVPERLVPIEIREAVYAKYPSARPKTNK